MKLDHLPGTKLNIHQDSKMFCMNSDTSLLGNFINIKHKDTVLDIGCNNGALLLYASQFQPKTLTGIDIQEEALALALENCDRYQIPAKFLCTRVQDYQEGPYSVLLCNPPYFQANAKMQNKNSSLAKARHATDLTMEELFQCAKRLLSTQGRFYLVCRVSLFNVVLQEASKTGIVLSRCQFAYSRSKQRAISIALEFAHKQKNHEVLVEKPVYWK